MESIISQTNHDVQNKIINEVKNLINHEDLISPYEWVNHGEYSHSIEKLLNSPELDKSLALKNLMKSYFDNYNKRLSKLIKVDAPPEIFVNQTEGYLVCIRRLTHILGSKD